MFLPENKPSQERPNESRNMPNKQEKQGHDPLTGANTKRKAGTGTDRSKFDAEPPPPPPPPPPQADIGQNGDGMDGTDGMPPVDGSTELGLAMMIQSRVQITCTSPKGKNVVWRLYHQETGAHDIIEENDLSKVVYELLSAKYKTSQWIGKIMRHLRTATATEREFHPAMRKDGLDFLYNVEDGVVRAMGPSYRTVTFEEHHEKWNFDATLPVKWGDGEGDGNGPGEPKALDELLKMALPDDKDKELYWLAMANNLCLDCHLEQAIVCEGAGGTSKSTAVLRVLQAVFRSGCQYLDLQQICSESSFGASKTPLLVKAIVNISSEMKISDLVETDKFKKLCSGEPVLGRTVYGKDELMADYHVKLWFIANRMPQIDGQKDVIRRFAMILFRVEHGEADIHLVERLVEERSAIFGRLLKRLPDVMKLSELPRGGAESEKARQKFVRRTDMVQGFIDDAVESWSGNWEDRGQPFTECETELIDAIKRYVESCGSTYPEKTLRCRLYAKLECKSLQRYIGKQKDWRGGKQGSWSGAKISVVFGLVLREEYKTHGGWWQ